MKQYITGEAEDNALFIYCTARLVTNPPTYFFISQDTTTLLILHLLSGMSQSSSFSGASKPNYNKNFPRSFLLNYGMALENLPDDKVLARLKDWNCEWLSHPNIAMSEFASTIKDNLPLIQQYKGTIFVPSFEEDLEQVVTPLIPQMQRLDNKDRATNAPPTQEDLLDLLEGVNNKRGRRPLCGRNQCGRAPLNDGHSHDGHQHVTPQSDRICEQGPPVPRNRNVQGGPH